MHCLVLSLKIQYFQEKELGFLLLKINCVLVCSLSKCFINLSSLFLPPTFLGFFLIFETWQLFFLWVSESCKQVTCLLNMGQRSLILWILRKNKILMKNLRFFFPIGCLPYCLISLWLFCVLYVLSYSVVMVLSSAQNFWARFPEITEERVLNLLIAAYKSKFKYPFFKHCSFDSNIQN